MQMIVYLPEVECEVSPGFLDGSYTVGVRDETGNQQFLQVPEGAVRKEGGKTYLSIGLVHVEHCGKRVLIELPQESDAGVNRLWLPFTSFRKEDGSQ